MNKITEQQKTKQSKKKKKQQKNRQTKPMNELMKNQ